MKIIIAGAHAIGTHLARLLSRSKEEITLIDESEERLASIGSDCDLLTMLGKPTSLKILRDAGVDDADLFIAVTPVESTNITASILAKNLGAKRTVARVDNPEYMEPQARNSSRTWHQQAHLSRDACRRGHQQWIEDELGSPALGCA